MEVDFDSVDFGQLLNSTKTYIVDLLNEYNKQYTEIEENTSNTLPTDL